MEERVFNAALAGLLHDVGKLEQRARIDPWLSAPGIEREGQPVHATWSAYFVQNYIPRQFRAAAQHGTYHHRPESSPAEDHTLSELVALADKLSAGERADLSADEKHPPRQLITIFDRIKLKGQGKRNGWHYLPLKPLSLDLGANLGQGVIFPQKACSETEQIQGYETLCELLRNAAKEDVPEPEIYLENLLSAMQRIAWCVPSAYYHSVPDVSLYDHSRMTAALAVCLSEMKPDKIKTLLNAVQNDFTAKASPHEKTLLNEPVTLLVGGDISGVQDFIYTISSKGAAKTLRGRSFYLQLLTEAVLRYVLHELGLPYTNVIYSGGGHFFLLAPLSAIEKLNEIRSQISRKLLRHHGTDLYLAIGFTKVPANGFRIGQFPIYWGEMHRALGIAKQRRYVELGEDLYNKVFEPPQYGGNPDDTCSVCGEDQRKVKELDEEHEEQARICSLCDSFSEQIGKRLPNASFIALGFGMPEVTKCGTAFDVLLEFGLRVQVLENANSEINLPGVDRIVIWALDDPKNNQWPRTGVNPVVRSLRYIVKSVPPMTFDKLQEKTVGGFKRLGVLRMDVDNLGNIFSLGFGETGAADNLATLARLSTLSFQVSMYFEGWVKKLCEHYPDLIYAVYAGGDDLFLIGPWDIMPALAQDIQRDFYAYTGEHPALHVSGGLAFIHGKYPIYQAAEDAADTLQQAKNLDGKDAFSFLGQAWPWTVFDGLIKKRDRLLHLVAHKKIDLESLESPQAIIQILRKLAADEADEARRMKNRPVWGPWMWMGAYQLKRMAERIQVRTPELSTKVDQLREELAANDYSEINQWGVVARWTQLLTRKTFQGKEKKE